MEYRETASALFCMYLVIFLVKNILWQYDVGQAESCEDE